MATRRNTTPRGGRDLTNSTYRSLTTKITPSTLHRLEPIRSLQDRREYHPEKQYRPAAAKNVNARKLVVKHHLAPKLSPKISFKIPNAVAICARRKIRKMVLHALGKTGKGGQRKPRYNWHSSISCKR